MVSRSPHVEREVRRALEQGALVLVYQPMVDLNDATLGGVEALLRWRSTDGLVPAAAFLPAVRDAQLLGAIADVVFDEAARQAAEWRRRFEAWRFPVAVNVARSDFDGGLVDRFAALRARYELPPGALAVDVSEGVLLGDDDHGALLRSIKDAGVQVVVDDFGSTSGDVTDPEPRADDRTTDDLMRSLVALEDFPVDVVKVDGALIDRCVGDARESELLESIVKLAHRFGFRLLAEAVESADEAERLRRIGFDLGQGHHFQRPHGPGHIDRRLHELADAREAFASTSRGAR